MSNPKKVGQQGNVQLTGSTVTIGADTFTVYNGNELHGLAADRPTAADAHAALPFAYYVSADTGAIEQTDGTNWVAVP